jgi:ABC-type nitrate/sulfonate/bicarbonate transport system substrate-binding protein
MTTRVLKVTVFPGGFNLPLTGLIRGDWDIGLTGFDNIVAYQEGQGEAEIDREPDLFAFMGGDSAFLRLVVQPNIRSYADLKGKTLSVDALTTGFAFVLRKMLALNGIAESDVQFERAGGVLQRFESLKAGRHAGTLLLTPFELIGQKAGLRLLQSASDLMPHYQGVVGATRRRWASENRVALVGFIRGYLDALAWLFGRTNRSQAAALLVEKVPNMSAELAAATCDVLLADAGGFDPKARIDRAGIATVLELRSEYGRPQKRLTDPEKYVELSCYNAALAK